MANQPPHGIQTVVAKPSGPCVPLPPPPPAVHGCTNAQIGQQPNQAHVTQLGVQQFGVSTPSIMPFAQPSSASLSSAIPVMWDPITQTIQPMQPQQASPFTVFGSHGSSSTVPSAPIGVLPPVPPVPMTRPNPPPPTPEMLAQQKQKRLAFIQSSQKSVAFQPPNPMLQSPQEPQETMEDLLKAYEISVPVLPKRDILRQVYYDNYYDLLERTAGYGTVYFKKFFPADGANRTIDWTWPVPDILKFCIAVLTMTQHQSREILNVTFHISADNQHWAFINFAKQSVLTPAGQTKKQWFHCSSVVGLMGILIRGRVLPQSPYTDSQGNTVIQKGFFSLSFLDGYSWELQNILTKLRWFGKNTTDIAVMGEIVGTGAPHCTNDQAGQVALSESSNHAFVHLKNHKTIIRSDKATLTGLVLRLEGSAPNGWDPADPLNLSKLK